MPLPPLPPRLTHAEASAYLDRCVAAARAGGMSTGVAWQLDASALADFDSSALAVLLALRRRALAAGGHLQVLGLSARLRDLAALYGVSELLPA
ncbi:STAS domain-containing protein [Macromonas nakdongensis]|uniref:STAS domain-containing protein n=1 Tax=Macromonas nakdongensis TaxID=1843082 RepID=UPI000C3441DB